MEIHEWDPGALLELSGYYWKTCALHAGVKLGVFTALGNESLNSEALAGRIGADDRALAMLLNALAAMGLLTKTGDVYSNTEAGRKFLSKESPQYVGHIIMHHHHLMFSWAELDQGVMTGKPVRSRASFADAEWRESFLLGMFNMAMSIAPQLAPLVDLKGRKHFLDLGGGPGTYAIHFCMQNQGLRATLFDLPTTRPFAEKTVAKFGLTDRIVFQEGNYLEDEITGTYDVACLSHILHGEGPEDCRMILKKAVAALEPGGLIMVHEFLLNNTLDGPIFPALFSLNMLLGTPSGQAYSEQHITDMLAECGIRDIRRLSFRGPNDSGIIAGIKYTLHG